MKVYNWQYKEIIAQFHTRVRWLPTKPFKASEAPDAKTVGSKIMPA